MSTALTLATLELYDPYARTGRTQRRFLCPFCGDTKPHDAAHRSLSVQARSGKWMCHRCGLSGLLHENRSVMPIPIKQAMANNKVRSLPAAKFDWRRAWERSVTLSHSPGAAYLASRGIPAVLAQQAGVRYSPRWYGHPAVLFPMRDQQGQLVAVSGRFVNQQSEIKTMTGGTRKQGIFSSGAAFKLPLLAIAEGPLDALSLAYCHLPAVALMGTSGPEWLSDIGVGQRICIATDADQPGDAAAEQLAETFSCWALQTTRLRPPLGKDWNDVLRQTDRLRVQQFIRNLIADNPVAQ